MAVVRIRVSRSLVLADASRSLGSFVDGRGLCASGTQTLLNRRSTRLARIESLACIEWLRIEGVILKGGLGL